MISVRMKKYGSESYLNEPSHLPKWAENTLSSVGSNIGNLVDPRRTWGDYQRAGIALSYIDPLLSKKCYMMVGSYPKSYYHAQHDPRGQFAMDEEYQSLKKNATRELVSLPPGRKLIQCKWVYRNKVFADG